MGVNVTADPEGHVKEQDHDSPQDDYCNWPGYKYWKRQMPTRDETYARNPITFS